MGWLKANFLRSRRYEDLTVSIQEHLAERVEELVEGGIPREDAERAARREFGNVTLIEERSREIWQWPTLESIWADIKFSFRQLRKAPGFTVTAVITLSLGIAVNGTMFSMVSAFLLAHLPGRNPQSIVVVSSVNPNPGDHADINPVSAPTYLAWRKDKSLFSEIAAADEFRTTSLTGAGQPISLRCAAVTANYFGLFGVSPEVGRSFAAEEDQPGRAHVAILSHGLWASRFGSDHSIVGRTIRLNREDYVVIGVMPGDFRLMGFTPELWTPLVLDAADQRPAARSDRSLYLFARLGPGVSLTQARAKLTILARSAEADYPAVERGWGAALRTLPDFIVYNFGIRSALAILMVTVAFILLIACVNVAGLLLARAAGRQKELAIRISIGAGRVRIVRQLITEGLVIALLGGSAGLLLTYVGIRLLRANLQFNEAISAIPLRLDANVLLFVCSVSLVSAVLSSLAPALKSARTDVNTDLKSESRTASAGRSHGRLRALLVSCEIALALFLLTGTSLLIRAVSRLDHQDLGFPTDHLLTAGLTLDQPHYPDEEHQRLFVAELISRLQHAPGTRALAIASDLPATDPARVTVRFKGEPEKAANEQRSTLSVVVTSGYFLASGIPLIRGRTFSDLDTAATPRVSVVNQEFVRRYLSGKDPLGVQIEMDVTGAKQGWRQVVGVVRDVKSYSEETRVDPEVYELFSQRPVGSFSVLVRTSAEPAVLIPALRQTVSEIDRELPLDHVMSMESVIDHQRNGNPFFTRVLGIFAALALVLAAIGIYGLAAYSVGQRTHEIGIRMAVGAKTADILRMVLQEGFITAAIGSLIGVAIALPLPKLFESMFVGIQFGAPVLHVVVLAVILMVAAFATYIPALRASRIDPKTALRVQ